MLPLNPMKIFGSGQLVALDNGTHFHSDEVVTVESRSWAQDELVEVSCSMVHVVRHAELPTLASTRDGRHRVDLVTEELFGFTDLKADHITYRPGDTAAAHYHVGARHIWFVSEGRGLFHVGEETYEVATGDVATAGDGEVHWFANPHDEPFAFYELWVPAPKETIWVDEHDI